jgi:hypothetical protein
MRRGEVEPADGQQPTAETVVSRYSFSLATGRPSSVVGPHRTVQVP